jgi:hypothetical protein
MPDIQSWLEWNYQHTLHREDRITVLLPETYSNEHDSLSYIGCETWSLAYTKEQSLKVFQERAIRKKIWKQGENVTEDGDNQTASLFFIKYCYSYPPREDNMWETRNTLGGEMSTCKNWRVELEDKRPHEEIVCGLKVKQI